MFVCAGKNRENAIVIIFLGSITLYDKITANGIRLLDLNGVLTDDLI